MENLIKPEFGLSFWTILIFLLLVVILSKLVWKPLLRQLDEREARIKKDIEEASALRRDAERYKAEIEKRLAEINREAEEMLKRVRDETACERERIIGKAHADAQLIIENAKKEIEQMKRDVERELERRVVDISVAISKRVLHEIVDKRIEERILEQTIKEHKKHHTN